MGNNIIALQSNYVVEIKDDNKGEVKKTRKNKTRLRESKKVTQRKVEEILSVDTDSCISIWQSVVVQAFYDLISKAENYEQKLDRANAVAWFGQGANLNGQQTDLQTVCELAGLDVFAVMKLAKQVIRGDKAKIISGFNFRTLRKDSSNRINRRK